MTKETCASAAPATPAYKEVIAYIKNSPISLTDDDILEKRHLLNNPPPAENLPEIAPLETKVISTSAENGTGTVTVTLVRPKGTENDTLPLAVYLHGGGWFLGSFKVSEKFIKDVVVHAHIVVAYVEYSLSPDVKYPVALEECYSSILWLHENSSSINVDPSKITVFGDSAGGNLSAAVTLLLKQRGHGSLLKSQILLYPATAHDRDDYDSYHAYGNGGYILTIPELTMMASFYHEEQYKLADGRNPGPKSALNAPLLAPDDELKDLPPCLTIIGECDLLRDEGEHYARRLTDAGVETCTVRVIGAVHGFFTLAPVSTPGDTPSETPQYKQSLGLIANYLKA